MEEVVAARGKETLACSGNEKGVKVLKPSMAPVCDQG
jgi:hypothetical protein